jgi:hypothetical protein
MQRHPRRTYGENQTNKGHWPPHLGGPTSKDNNEKTINYNAGSTMPEHSFGFGMEHGTHKICVSLFRSELSPSLCTPSRKWNLPHAPMTSFAHLRENGTSHIHAPMTSMGWSGSLTAICVEPRSKYFNSDKHCIGSYVTCSRCQWIPNLQLQVTWFRHSILCKWSHGHLA